MVACAEMPGNLVSPAIRQARVRQSTRGSREFPSTTRKETISDERALSVEQHSVVEDCHTLLQTNIAQGAAGSVFPLDEVTHTHTYFTAVSGAGRRHCNCRLSKHAALCTELRSTTGLGSVRQIVREELDRESNASDSAAALIDNCWCRS